MYSSFEYSIENSFDEIVVYSLQRKWFEDISFKSFSIIPMILVNQLMEYTGMKDMEKILDHLGISHRMEDENYSSDSDQFDMENEE